MVMLLCVFGVWMLLIGEWCVRKVCVCGLIVLGVGIRCLGMRIFLFGVIGVVVLVIVCVFLLFVLVVVVEMVLVVIVIVLNCL